MVDLNSFSLKSTDGKPQKCFLSSQLLQSLVQKKPQGANKPLKGGIWGENCPSLPPPPPQRHKCLLSSSTCPLEAIQTDFSKISLLCLVLGDINCTSAGLLPWGLQQDPGIRKKKATDAKKPHKPLEEAARSCPSSWNNSRKCCHRAGHGKSCKGEAENFWG